MEDSEKATGANAHHVHFRVYATDPVLRRAAYVLWALALIAAFATVALFFSERTYRLSALAIVLAVALHLSARNCYYNLRHDERADDLLG